ncbi:MAG: DUF933 domain-containing protein, partial [Thermodesulfovibrio sp.]|nr:DUF933 domain-containing protein [Thermodesulfovibrio sp.]
ITSSEIVHKGVISLKDFRLDKISEILNPKKVTSVQIECIDPAGFIKGNTSHNNQILKVIGDADLFIYILRGFEKPEAPYQFEDVDPERDLKELDYEFLIADLDLVIKRLERMSEQKKKGQRINEKEMETLKFIAKYLESNQPLRSVGLTEENIREIRHLNFFTLKPTIAIINADEKFIKSKNYNSQTIVTDGELEAELVKFSEKERLNFLKELGIEKPLNYRVGEKVYEILNYITFFTVVSEEVRAWSIKRGTKAWEAAGKIHSDIQRGFIKAEIISFRDFIEVRGDFGLAKQKGILRFEGKDYEVKDGEIITFRFKV